jgi:hypothetical protein
MLPGATAETTIRLLLGAVDYDAFLGECNQAVVVDTDAAASIYGRLLADSTLRQKMGCAGRERVEQHFTWERVVKAYERLWREQETERQAYASVATKPRTLGPPCYPAPEVSFAGYPTALLGDEDLLASAPESLAQLPIFLKIPLCSYSSQRIQNEATLIEVLMEAMTARSLNYLTGFLLQKGPHSGSARATLAWLLKYGLLRRKILK